MTPLIWASMNGHKEVAQILIGAGADMYAQDNVSWESQLGMQVNKGWSLLGM